MNRTWLIGLVVTITLHVGLVALVIYFEDDGDKTSRAEESILIEATVKIKSNPRRKQPQKVKRAVSNRTGATTDQKPPDKKPDKKEKKDPIDEDPEAFLKSLGEGQAETGVEEDDPTVPGDFDGSEHGWALADKGHPYLRELALQARQVWELPTLERGEADAMGCLQITPDGRIKKFELCKSSENSNIDRSVRLALQRLQKLRDDGKYPVPSEIMREVTRQWRKLRFPVKKQD